MYMRAFLIVLDSVGIGEAPDADAYGDVGSSTFAHIADSVDSLEVPILRDMGLGNIPFLLPNGLPIKNVPRVAAPTASYGAMQEVSKGKDTTTGHWEIAGLELKEGFRVFPPKCPSFPTDLVKEFEIRTGRQSIGNLATSGTKIIEKLGEQQMREGCWIIYTSADSVFQVAAHEDVIPLEELYKGCEVARELCNNYKVGRVIARPYIGEPGGFVRTENRRDYSYPLPEETVLDKLVKQGISVTTVGKLDDVFAHRGITKSLHVENNADAQGAMLKLGRTKHDGLIFGNLIDFDMLYGHRRDPHGYAKALEEADSFLGELVSCLKPEDVLIITADHGNDPTFKGTDHTREFVPLLVCRRGRTGRSLGVRHGFYDIAQSVARFFGIEPLSRGQAFLEPSA